MSKILEEDATASRLKFYSKLKESEKISLTPTPVIYSDTWYNSILHKFSLTDNSRAIIFEDIKKTIDKIFEIVSSLLIDFDQNKLKIEYYIKDLNVLTYEGLPNFKKTYEDDRMFDSVLSTLIEDINFRMHKLTQTNTFVKDYIQKEKLFGSILDKIARGVVIGGIVSGGSEVNRGLTSLLPPPMPLLPPPSLDVKKVDVVEHKKEETKKEENKKEEVKKEENKKEENSPADNRKKNSDETEKSSESQKSDEESKGRDLAKKVLEELNKLRE